MKCYKIQIFFRVVSIVCCCVVTVAFAGVDFNIDSAFNVPNPFYSVGDLFVTGSGSIDGNLLDAESLNIGKDIFGSIIPTNFVAAGTIGGVPTIQVYAGSALGSTYSISGVTNSFEINQNAAATIDGIYTGTGIVTNNGALTLGLNNLFYPTGLFYNNNDLNIIGEFTPPSNFINPGNIYMVGNGSRFHGPINSFATTTLHIGKDSSDNIVATQFNFLDEIGDISSISIYTGSSFNLAVGADFTLKTSIVGDGVVNNNGTINIVSGGSIAAELNNANSINIYDDFIVPNVLVNSGDLCLVGNGKIIGDLNGGANLNLGKDSNNIVNPVNYTTSGNVSNIQNINVYAGSFTTGASDLISGLSGALNIFPDATVNFNGTYSGAGAVDNYGVLNINNNFSGGAVINKNSGNMHIFANSSAVSFVNLGLLTIEADLDTAANDFINYGAVYVKGRRTLTAPSFIGYGSQYFTITDDVIHDKLIVNGDVNLSGQCELVISSAFIGESGVDYSWGILSGDSLFVDDTTNINIPYSSLHKSWRAEVTETGLNVLYRRNCFTTNVTKKASLELAKLIEAIACNPENCGHINLVNALGACASQEDYDDSIKQLMPSVNSNSNYKTVHNAVFNRVETRISKINDSFAPQHGIAVGDINESMAAWVAGFGTVANQKAINDNLGYRATALGTIIGIDALMPNDDIYGLAVAISNSNVIEASNLDTKTRILGYHALLYGNNYFYGNNFFEWLFTGIINKNNGVRGVNLNNVSFNVNSSYRNAQVGARINIGKNIDFYNWGIGQVNTLQYSFLHQPSYNEDGSSAALHIAALNNNIVTIGSGVRVFFRTNSASPLIAKPAFHAMLTYDAVSSDQGITSNFIIGSSDFTISQNPSRVAVKLGFDVGCEIRENWQLQFSYDLELRNRYSDNSGEIKVKYLF